MNDRCGTGGRSSDLMPAYRKDGKPRKRNTYQTECVACGRTLLPNAGVIELKREGGWAAFCAEPLT